MSISDIVFATHLVPKKIRKMQRPKLLVILTGKIEAITQMDYWLKVTPKRSYFGPIILTPF